MPGVRNQKFYFVPDVINGKLYWVPNDSYEKFYLAVKGLKYVLFEVEIKFELNLRHNSNE